MIEEKYIEYGVYMNKCLIATPIVLENISDNVLKIVIETEDKEDFYNVDKIIRLYLSKSIGEEKEIENEARSIIDNVLNAIAYNVKWSSIGSPYYKGSKGLKKRFRRNTDFEFIEMDSEGAMRLESSIKNFYDYDKEYFKLFKAAMSCDDVMAQYMLLYQILLIICKDKDGNERQETLDNRINNWYLKTKGKEISWYQPSGRKNKETIFTKLRNQVGHSRNVSFDKTIKEMAIYIDDLIDIVKYEMKH